MKKNVLITGGTGFIGKQLTRLLLNRGFSVSILSRSDKKNTKDVSYYKWDVSKNSIQEAAVLHADYIIHLAGENIAEKRWTARRKAAIVKSREQSTQLIYSVLKNNNKKLDAFISASAIGIYGAFNSENICDESTPAATDFLGIACQKWEAATEAIRDLQIRTVQIRTGLVLGKEEGFLSKIAPIFKFGLGAALGSGKQYMPWIYVTDLCHLYLEAITNSKMNGPYNAAINDNTTNLLFSKALAKVYGFKLWLPNVPSFLIRLGMGEMAKIVLTGQRVSSEKAEQLGFKFEFKKLNVALEDCLISLKNSI